jgi:MFS family permease
LITSIFGLLLAAPKYNYGAICGIYFLASLGLGGNIPIDAIIAHEFLPQSKRHYVTLLSLWQPIGVVAASGIAYGTAAKYRCGATLPSCRAVAAGEACCSVSSNMGWRYEVIILGGVTLLIFFARYGLFSFQESPKFLVSRGKEAEAIQVLHNIAKFNKAPMPTLTLDHFAAIDAEAKEQGTHYAAPVNAGDASKHVVRNFFNSFKHLKGLFNNRLQSFTFALLAFAYMVCCTSYKVGILY